MSPRKRAIKTKGKRLYRRHRRGKAKIVLGGKRVARIPMVHDSAPLKTRPLINKKRTTLSIAFNNSPGDTPQRNLPEQPKKRKGAAEMSWKNKFQKQ